MMILKVSVSWRDWLKAVVIFSNLHIYCLESEKKLFKLILYYGDKK